ncbi:MAG: general secretion pathway protein GspC [Gammaproteobacteria bacterium]|nr:general secretion pathway protein GspC [Gammaproteobacteria bacterium]MCH9717445.1 general secretion pathway protein GspC [Gammaproteobacteria bacterium]MCH9764040.1 general secretion pathway protein GspC [Gammaproteobacteria bacterium]
MNWIIYLKNNAFKIIAGVLLALIVFEWISGIRAAVRLDKTTTSYNKPVFKKTASLKALIKSSAVTVPLFGDYVPNDVEGAGVERSSLDVSVVGILFASDENASHVMLALPGGEVKSFGVGDKLPGGAVIKRITSEGVLLLYQGRMESLILPKNELLFSPPSPVLKQD